MSEDLESVESFRLRAREYIRDNFKPLESGTLSGLLRTDRPDEEELEEIQHERDLQRLLYDGGLAGVCVPVEYGGRGLTSEHQRALNEEIAGFEYPVRIQAPTMSPCMAVLLDFGTDEQKRTHIPAILKGEELWMQFLSEPSSGSDVAGALTTAIRDGEEWILNGSKVWTTGAWWSDWGLCLARTNWDVEKHRGLSVFIFPIHQSGIEVQRIALINGFRDFCQEFLTDLRVPDSDRVGEVDDGWTVGSRWMFHERMLHNSPYVTMPEGESRSGTVVESALRVAREVGHLDDPRVRDLVGEAHMLNRVSIALLDRLGEGIRVGALPDQSASIGRLLTGSFGARSTDIAYELAEADAAAWSDDDGPIGGLGVDQLMRQVGSIGGGTTEMARNVIAERVLGMPRERRMDKGVAFRDVPRGSA
jgi:alkylation response protein AidB-like acyl-CoA dehydrogenase